MAWTYAQLSTAYRALSPKQGDAADAATLNAQTTVSVPQDFPWSQIRQILMGGGPPSALDWGSLVQVAQTPIGAALPAGASNTAALQSQALFIMQCALYGGLLKASDATIWAKVAAAGTALSAANVAALSSATVNAVVALRTPTLSVWSPTVQPGDVTYVRLNP